MTINVHYLLVCNCFLNMKAACYVCQYEFHLKNALSVLPVCTFWVKNANSVLPVCIFCVQNACSVSSVCIFCQNAYSVWSICEDCWFHMSTNFFKMRWSINNVWLMICVKNKGFICGMWKILYTCSVCEDMLLWHDEFIWRWHFFKQYEISVGMTVGIDAG